MASASPPRPWQFSLRVALAVLIAASVLLAIGVQFPDLSFATTLILLPLVPLLVAAGLTSLMFPLRWLGFIQRKDPPTIVAGLATAIIFTTVLVVLWPTLREIGGCQVLLIFQPLAGYEYTFADASRSIRESFFNANWWFRVGHWELWAVSRWWLLFGSLTALWLAVSLPFRAKLQLESARQTTARLLAFAPWIMLLEIAFLFGVWIDQPATVPEPSTGFVVGIFSWDLWHWDCWLDRGWLIRGALPTFIVGSVFFSQVLRWRWWAALVSALALVPVALMLSIAWTVAFRHGFPWPG